MKELDISKYTKYTLELIFAEADKLQGNLLKSISENTNKSFLLFAIYTSIISFSFFKLIEKEYSYCIILVGGISGCLFIIKNLFPNYIEFNGALPENMVHEYFNNFKEEELDKEYLATQIQSYNFALKKNNITIEKMVRRFFTSVSILIVTLFIFSVITCFFSFTECAHT